MRKCKSFEGKYEMRICTCWQRLLIGSGHSNERLQAKCERSVRPSTHSFWLVTLSDTIFTPRTFSANYSFRVTPTPFYMIKQLPVWFLKHTGYLPLSFVSQPTIFFVRVPTFKVPSSSLLLFLSSLCMGTTALLSQFRSGSGHVTEDECVSLNYIVF